MLFKKYGRIFIFIIAILLLIISFIDIKYSSIEAVKADSPIINHKGTYYIFVDCVESRLYLFKNNELIKTYKCAGGKPSTPSPVGTWTIVSKSNWGEGFGGSWMGFNVPWGKFGIHGTDKPNSIGWPSSHGCIRMYNDEAKELRMMVPVGTKVTIEDGNFGNFSRGFRTLSSGKYGADVKVIQQKLKELGFYHGNPHGYFDKGTVYAVNAFQKKNGLRIQDKIGKEFYNKLGLIQFE